MFYLLRAPVVKNYAKLAIDIKKKPNMKVNNCSFKINTLKINKIYFKTIW